jgi:pyruvate/2-oxoglutarate dehydrogenase complex dihydrolipoamide dehydrogenase (E3) component
MKSAIRQCIACNVCHDRLSGEIDVSCVQNPMMGTHFETLGFMEEAHKSSLLTKRNPKRILILGSGVSGLESARASAELGHVVEVWEQKTTLGGQISLATAAPHKEEVENAWSYRFNEAKRLNVQIKAGVIFTTQKVKEFNPDLIIMATGAIPKVSPVDLTKVQSSIKIHQAWEVLANPGLIKNSSQVTVLGGGTVGIETADLLLEKSCKVTIIEYKKALAEGLSKSNRREILDRLENAAVQIFTNANIINVMPCEIEFNINNGLMQKVSIGDALLIAVGAQPKLSLLGEIQDLGISYVVVGDANSPGDFMSCIRDAWMVGSSVDRYIDKII